MLGSGYEYNMLIKSVPETELWKRTYVTAVLNVGWCSKQKRGRRATKKGDYKSKKQSKVFFEANYDDYEADIELKKVH